MLHLNVQRRGKHDVPVDGLLALLELFPQVHVPDRFRRQLELVHELIEAARRTDDGPLKDVGQSAYLGEGGTFGPSVDGVLGGME